MKKNPPRTVHDFILWAARLFDDAELFFGHGTDNVQDEAAWLVGNVLKIPPAALDAHLKDKLSLDQQNALHALVDARIITRKPLAYLLNEAWFAGLKFYVDERVIVPRSLTGEFINEQFKPWVKPAQVHRILDLCTGSGCMAIALAQAFPQVRVDAADISADALAVARINVESYGLRERVRLLRSDLFSALKNERYDLIVTNPPYAANDEMKMLPPEYRHEPALALASGERGLDAITAILTRASEHLNAGGFLVAEVGNSAITLQHEFPTVPFMWLNTADGDESVFLLTAEQLQHHHAALTRSVSQ